MPSGHYIRKTSHLEQLAEARKKNTTKPPSWEGKTHSDETRKKIGLAHKNKLVSLETREKQSLKSKGRKMPPRTLEYRKALSERQKGNKSNSWKGGITPLNKIIRHSLEYKLWRTSVFERDNYTCIWCGERGGSLNADHIKPFAFFPELRFAIDNGRTLCVACHKTTTTYAKRKL